MERILNVGAGKDRETGSDWIDAYPQFEGVIKVDFNKDKFPYEDNTFDQVIVKQVLAHLTNKDHCLHECYRVLKPNGVFLLTTDNAAFYGLFTNTHMGDYDKYASRGELDKSYSLFTKEQIKRWLMLVGFKEIKVEYFMMPPAKGKRKSTFKRMMMIFIGTIIDRIYPNIIATATK